MQHLKVLTTLTHLINNAHPPNQVVRWSSLTSFVSNSLVSFLFAPLVGHASDARGRRPFLIAAFVLALLPSLAVVGHLVMSNPGDTLMLYYPASAISGAVPSIVVCLSYTADIVPPRHRTVSDAAALRAIEWDAARSLL